MRRESVSKREFPAIGLNILAVAVHRCKLQFRQKTPVKCFTKMLFFFFIAGRGFLEGEMRTHRLVQIQIKRLDEKETVSNQNLYLNSQSIAWTYVFPFFFPIYCRPLLLT